MFGNPLFGDDERSVLSAFWQSPEEQDEATMIFSLLRDFYIISNTSYILNCFASLVHIPHYWWKTNIDFAGWSNKMFTWFISSLLLSEWQIILKVSGLKIKKKFYLLLAFMG